LQYRRAGIRILHRLGRGRDDTTYTPVNLSAARNVVFRWLQTTLSADSVTRVGPAARIRFFGFPQLASRSVGKSGLKASRHRLFLADVFVDFVAENRDIGPKAAALAAF